MEMKPYMKALEKGEKGTKSYLVMSTMGRHMGRKCLHQAVQRTLETMNSSVHVTSSAPYF